MSQKATYHIQDFHFDYYCIIPNRSNSQVLMLLDEGGWTLPYFVPYEHHYGVVGHINQEMKVQLGLDVTTLRCFYDSEIDDKNYSREAKTVCRVYAMENHSPHWTPPTNANWIDFNELNSLTFANLKLRSILASWVNKLAQETNPKQRVPWAEIGWFKEAKAWINLQLNLLGLNKNTVIEQTIAWEISCLFKVRNTSSNFYFKAADAGFDGEANKTHLLAQLYPDRLPNLLAIDTEKRWMLMEEFRGDHLKEIADIAHWEKALKLFAQMQIQAVDRVNMLLDFGFPDRRLDQLINQIEPLFANMSVLLPKEKQGLDESDLETLRSLIPKLKAMCYELAACGIPPTLVHGDFHCQNVVLTNEAYIYFDWSDAAIAHPFFDMVYFLQYEKQLPNVTDVQVRLRNAYLEPWTVYLPMKQLIEIFKQAQPLSLLSRAIVDCQVIENMEEESKQAWRQVVPYWLKKLLKQIQSGV